MSNRIFFMRVMKQIELQPRKLVKGHEGEKGQEGNQPSMGCAVGVRTPAANHIVIMTY